MDRSYLCLKQHFPLRIISVHFKNIFAFDTRISFTSYWDHANRQYIIRSHKCLQMQQKFLQHVQEAPL